MNTRGLKNLGLALLLACFFHNGQKICLEPQGGGSDTGNPKGQPTNDHTKPVKIEQRLEQMQLEISDPPVGSLAPEAESSIARGGHEFGPKTIKT